MSIQTDYELPFFFVANEKNFSTYLDIVSEWLYTNYSDIVSEWKDNKRGCRIKNVIIFNGSVAYCCVFMGGMKMKYTKLGSSDLNVSRICMGCMGFGDAKNGQHSWTIDEEHSREIIKRGLELGVNFFDTAIGYQSGTSEQYLGRALRDFTNRDKVVVATKFLPRTPDEISAGISGQKHIEKMINKSLENLGMDYIDLYIYHMWDWNTPICDILDRLHYAVTAGRARSIGISTCFA